MRRSHRFVMAAAHEFAIHHSPSARRTALAFPLFRYRSGRRRHGSFAAPAAARTGGTDGNPVPEPLHGFLLLGVVEGGREPDVYRRYEVQLAAGRILRVHKQKITGTADRAIELPHRLGGEMRGCRESPLLPSPDARFTAYCFPRVEPGRISDREFNNDFEVVDSGSQRKVFTGRLPQDQKIEGLFWAPHSRALAILSTTQRTGMGPLDLLSAATGNPIPLVTSYLHIYDLASHQHAEIVIRQDAAYGATRILDWWF